MVALSNLAPASFRGARFLVPKDNIEEGRNTIDHKFPNSARRYAEDNGMTPSEYHLTMVLHGPTLMSDWSRLRSALNTPGPGTLRHPYDGAQQCQVKGTFKVSRDDKDSGVLEIECVFLKTDGASFPSILTGGIAATITSLSGAAVATAFSKFTASFQMPLQAGSRLFVGGLTTSITNSVTQQFTSTAVNQASSFLRQTLR